MATVLVLDDRAASREIARAVLDHGGYRVVEAGDGAQALTLAGRLHPDAVVADLLLPGMDGYEFVQRLRTVPSTADIPVVFYTANYRPEEAGPLADAYGVCQVLAKSGDPLELLAAVDRAVSARATLGPGLPGANLAGQHLQTVNAKLLEKIEALDSSEARFTTVAELSPMGIVVGTADGAATYVNQRLGEMIQVNPAELLGNGWTCCLAEGDRANLWAGDPAVPAIRHHGRVVLANQQARWLTVVIRRQYDTIGQPSGFVAMIDDVTPLIEAEEERYREARDREFEERRQITDRFDSLARLCGRIAHDFNNLLNVILSFGDFARESVSASAGAVLATEAASAIDADLAQIETAGKRAAHLTHQLLTFGRRELSKPAVVDVNAAVTEVWYMVNASIGRHVRVTTELEPALAHVRVDRGQLCQVLLNLTDNARDAMAHGGELHLATANETITEETRHRTGLASGAYIRVTVRDTGCGMSPEITRQAMEPFFTTKPKGQGTGLGLATAYGIVKQAGGEVVIDSAPDRGTRVDVYLPGTDEPLDGPPAVTGEHAPAGRTVLLAEDEDGLREAATRILTRAGYQVLAAADGQEALLLARDHPGPIHLLLSDVVMPRMNGSQLARELSRIRPDTPVLYMSGYADPLMTDQGLLDPGVVVVSKPFTRTDLLIAVGAALAASGPAPG